MLILGRSSPIAKTQPGFSASSLDGVHATLMATRKQQADDREALKAEDEALPGLDSSAKEQAETMSAAEQQTARAKEELKAAAPILQKVRSLDQKLADQEKAVTAGDEACKKDSAKIDADTQTRLKEQEKRIKAQQALELVEGDLKEHAR